MTSQRPPRDDPSPPRFSVQVDCVASGGRLALIELPSASGLDLPRHRHHWEDELVVVVAGRLAVWLDGAWIEAGAGGTVFLPRGSEHALVATTDETRLLIAFTPAGFEGFYRELAAGEGDADLARLIALAARYGVEVTGPPPIPCQGRPRSILGSTTADAPDGHTPTPPHTTSPTGGPSWQPHRDGSPSSTS